MPIMIKHERLILEKLTENPMLSQGELAAMLNLTRSSISVYISHLMQMGYIRGRGYLIEDHNTIYVVGTASIDYRTTIDEALLRDPTHTATLDDNELNIDFGGIGKTYTVLATMFPISAPSDPTFLGKSFWRNAVKMASM